MRRTRAAEAPMASPSEPTWVVTATRSRVFKTSAISESVLFFVRVVICPYLPKSGFYLGRTLDDGVGLEVQPGRPLEARLGPYRGLDAARRALQTFVCCHLVLTGEHAVEHRRMGEVGAHPDAGDRDEALDARVRERGHLLARYLFELRLHLARATAHGLALIASRTPRASRGWRAPRR